MAEMSRRFNFDDFDEQIREALEENESLLVNLYPFKRPGEIGGVACRPTLTTDLLPASDQLPDPPEAA